MLLPSSQLVVTLEERPDGIPREGEHLVFAKGGAMPHMKSGECLVRNLFMSLDPAMRPSMSIDTYVKRVAIGETMRSTTIGEVVTAAGAFAIGDVVIGPGGWQEYFASKPHLLQRVSLPVDMPLTSALGILGGTGLTAYFGFLRVGQPKAGETVVVSGAAGATGNIVCQIAKHVMGCRVVGIAGGEAKCRYLIANLGLDAAINYKKGGDLNKAIKEACPGGIDIYFDNVGGDILNQCLRRMNTFGRVVMCGAISGYNRIGSKSDVGPGIPAQYASSIVSSRIRMQGFIVLDYTSEWPKALKQLSEWIREGKLKNQETIVEGLENAGAAFRGLFEGMNTGKLMVKIAEPQLGGSHPVPGKLNFGYGARGKLKLSYRSLTQSNYGASHSRNQSRL